MDPCILNSSEPPNGSRTGGRGGDPGCSSGSLPARLSVDDLLPPPFPSIPEVCRARVRAEKPVRRPAEGPLGGTEGPDELPASRAAELLLHAESALLQRRERRRLANRTQLQELIGRLDELVFIPL